MKIMHQYASTILFSLLLCVGSHLVNAMNDQEYVNNLLKTVGHQTTSLALIPRQLQTAEDWYNLLVNQGRLHACIELGMITDEAMKQNINHASENIAYAYLANHKGSY